MSFVTLDSTKLVPGKAVTTDVMLQIKSNFDDHESRITSISGAAAPVEIFNMDVANASSASSLTGLVYHEVLSPITITQVKIQIFQKGGISSGNLEVDLKAGTTPDDSTQVSILTTKPILNFATAADYGTNSGVMNGSLQTVSAGTILRLDVTQLPTIPLPKFRILVYGHA